MQTQTESAVILDGMLQLVVFVLMPKPKEKKEQQRRWIWNDWQLGVILVRQYHFDLC